MLPTQSRVIFLIAHTLNFHTLVSDRLAANVVPKQNHEVLLRFKFTGVLVTHFKKCVLSNIWSSGVNEGMAAWTFIRYEKSCMCTYT